MQLEAKVLIGLVLASGLGLAIAVNQYFQVEDHYTIENFAQVQSLFGQAKAKRLDFVLWKKLKEQQSLSSHTEIVVDRNSHLSIQVGNAELFIPQNTSVELHSNELCKRIILVEASSKSLILMSKKMSWILDAKQAYCFTGSELKKI